MMHTIAFGMPGMGEWVVIAAVGLLFFGKRLPEALREQLKQLEKRLANA